MTVDPDRHNGQAPRVVAVVVTYRPSPEALQGLLCSLAAQVARVVVVDNGGDVRADDWSTSARGNAEMLSLGDNLGVAAAQNRGIARARQLGAAYVLLMDQDSMPAPDMVVRLLAAASQLQDRGVLLAAVGPNCRDERNATFQPFMRQGLLGFRRQRCRPGDGLVEAHDLISSGSLIPLTALETVGGMAEELFIDYVDTEWFLRARRHGFRAFGVCDAVMSHVLGDSVVHLPGRAVVLHSALRHYYMFRNSVWLHRQGWVPMRWKVADGWRLLQRGAFYPLFARPRCDHLRMILRGMRDGWRGRMGRFDPV